MQSKLIPNPSATMKLRLKTWAYMSVSPHSLSEVKFINKRHHFSIFERFLVTQACLVVKPPVLLKSVILCLIHMEHFVCPCKNSKQEMN